MTMKTANKRIVALDVLRGLTVAMMILVNNTGHYFTQLSHVEWNGMTMCDMVFPFFLFVMGVSTYLSLSKTGFESSGANWWHICRRTVLIILVCWCICWLDNAVYGDFFPFGHLRLTGVLVRIALSYGILSALALCVSHKSMPWIAGGLLALYAALLLMGNGYAADETSVLYKVDVAVLGKSHLYAWAPVDPEGLLGLVPSVAHAILGFLCGSILASADDIKRRMTNMAGYAVFMLCIGMGLTAVLPLNKMIWSPSFVLVTCGSAQLLLAALMYIIDYKGIAGWTGVLRVFGTNSLLAYVLSEVLAVVLGRFGVLGWWHGLMDAVIPSKAFADLACGLSMVAVCYAVCFILYRKRIIVKL